MTVIDLLEQRLQKIRITGKGSVHLSPDVTEIIIDELKKYELLKQNLESNDEINIPKMPKQYTEPRFGMGYEYYDWKCPTCNKFLAYEPNVNGIPRRCQNCGQLLKTNI